MAGSGALLCKMLGALATTLVLVAAFNVVANPYGLWSCALIDPVYLRVPTTEPSVARQVVPYRVRGWRPRTVLLGTSRAAWGMPIEQGQRDGIQNAALVGATLDELAILFGLALSNPALERILLEVDFFTFSAGFTGFRDERIRRRLELDPLVVVEETLLGREVTKLSQKAFVRWLGGEQNLPVDRVVRLPWPAWFLRARLDDVGTGGLVARAGADFRKILTGVGGVYLDYRASDDRFELFRDLVARAARARVDVVPFIGPMSEYDLELVRQTGRWSEFLDWKRRLAAIAIVRDYSGYNALGTDDRWFRDVWHYKPAVGHAILRQLLKTPGPPCGSVAEQIHSAVRTLDPSRIDEHLRADERRMRTRVEQSSKALRVVEHHLANACGSHCT